MPIHNNRIVVDLNKVQYAKFYYTNQYGQSSTIKPFVKSVRLQPASASNLALFHPDYPKESEYERAARLNLLDVWTPTLYLKLQANSALLYTGDKAVSIYKEFCARVFNKGNKKGKG